VTGAAGSGERALQSMRLLVDRGVEFEARTTVHPDLLDADSLDLMADELVAQGVRRWVLQPYRHEGSPKTLRNISFRADDVPAGIAQRFEHFSVR